MEKYKNILNREDYIDNVNEGKIGNFLRNGVKKMKSGFEFFAKKIKNIITFFDTDGNVLPVVSLHAVADHFKGDKNVVVCCSDEVNKEVKQLGGKGCEVKIETKTDADYTDDVPDGAEEYVNWVKNDYEKTNFYTNLKKLQKIIKESNNIDIIDGDLLNEEVLTIDKTVSYKGKEEGTGTEEYSVITSEEFEGHITERINFYCNDKFNNEERVAPGNMLIFGAPGIGKSTIPNQVVEEYNKIRENKDRIAIISVNCANINPGDFLMPAFPKAEEVFDYIENNIETLSKAEKVHNLSDENKERLKMGLKKSGQMKAQSAPQPWLPCYRHTGDKFLDKALDIAANGGKMLGKERYEEDEYGDMEKVRETYRTGSGGILLLDEFLRAKPSVFDELMNFLLERRLNDWYLGSKWFIVACSNRPCDDERTAESWSVLGGAGRDRWGKIFNMDPEPEQWAKWARTKGFDETLLKFIFDKSSDSLVNGQYTRFYRVVNKDNAENDSHKPVTPRNWMRAHGDLVNFMCDNRERFKDGFSISKMDFNEVKKALSGTFDDSFLYELVQWLETHCGSEVDLDAIIKDPVGTPMPMGKNIDEVKVIDNLLEKMCERYKSTEEIKDDEFSQIIIWLGINFKNNYNVFAQFIGQIAKRMNSKSLYLTKHTKSFLLIASAFPSEDEIVDLGNTDEEHIKMLNCFCKENEFTKFKLNDPSDVVPTIKKFAKEYFPWRIDGNDEFKYIFDYDANGGEEGLTD